MTRLSVPPWAATADRPVASVVMVTYGARLWVEGAIAALIDHTDLPFELIVVDNASADGTPELLRQVEGATVIFNERNVGFGPGSNQGVLHAVGTYVCMLNSDALVEAGWLRPLVEALEHDPRAGAAAPALLHPDGTLQEAAGVVGSEATTRALGDGEPAEDLQYRFRRYVDYASAACLLVRRSAFLRAGGFDAAFPMGYCEDVDLCFALRELGLRTVYEPRSRVRHVRWGSSSRTEADRRVFANQPILLARWGERLAGRPSFREVPPPAYRMLQARDAEAVDRLLVVTDGAWGCLGSTPTRPGALAAEIQRLWPEARLTVLAAPGRIGADLAGLMAAGVEVAAEEDWDPWFARRRFHYSTVLLCGPVCSECFGPVLGRTQPQAARILDLVGLLDAVPEHLAPWWSGGSGGDTNARLEATEGLRGLVADAIRGADVVTCASAEALAAARAVAPGTPAFVIPAPTDPGLEQAAGFGEGLGFTVLGDLPPLPFEASETAELTEPLRRILSELDALAPEAAEHVSFVDGSAEVCAPLGAGTAPPDSPPGAPARVHLLAPPFMGGSITASIAGGIPSVTWPGGAEGLGLGELEAVLVADNPADFARKAWSLHNDQALWERVRRELLVLAGERLDPTKARRALMDALAACGWTLPQPAQGVPAGAGVSAG